MIKTNTSNSHITKRHTLILNSQELPINHLDLLNVKFGSLIEMTNFLFFCFPKYYFRLKVFSFL